MQTLTDYNFVFNLVFLCDNNNNRIRAMAERTKFLSYCIYSRDLLVVSDQLAGSEEADGFSQKLGTHDFAGSCAIHMVGGVTAFINCNGGQGGKFSGCRMEKVTSHTFPGHNTRNRCSWMFHPLVWMLWFNGVTTTGHSLHLSL